MKTTKIERIGALYVQLARLGFRADETTALLRIERALRRWHELECGTGDERVTRNIERDEVTGRPFMCIQHPANFREVRDRRYLIPDREKAAVKRLAAIVEARNARGYHKSKQVVPYVQGDPRGCALYLITRAQIGANQIDEVYLCGLAVCE